MASSGTFYVFFGTILFRICDEFEVLKVDLKENSFSRMKKFVGHEIFFGDDPSDAGFMVFISPQHARAHPIFVYIQLF